MTTQGWCWFQGFAPAYGQRDQAACFLRELLAQSGPTRDRKGGEPCNVRGYNCGSMIGGKPSLRCALILAVALWGGPAVAQEAPGRIIATVTTLEGTVRMTGVMVDLRAEADGLVIARTESDGAGRVEFPDVPPGRYVLASNHQGFLAKETAVFDVRAGQATEVLFDIQLEFEFPEVEVRGDLPSPTDSVQPVSMSDMLSGSVLESAPLEGDDFQSLLPLLPGVVRGHRRTLAHPRRRADPGRPADQQRQPHRSFDGRLRSRAARHRASTRSRCWRIPLPPSTAGSPRASHRSGRGAAPTTGRSRPAT